MENECYLYVNGISVSKPIWLHDTVEESQSEAERTDFPLIRQKCPGRDAECKGLHPGLAGLLRDWKHKDNNAKMGRVAKKKIPLLHLETVETPQNEGEEPCKPGNAPVAGL